MIIKGKYSRELPQRLGASPSDGAERASKRQRTKKTIEEGAATRSGAAGLNDAFLSQPKTPTDDYKGPWREKISTVQKPQISFDKFDVKLAIKDQCRSIGLQLIKASVKPFSERVPLVVASSDNDLLVSREEIHERYRNGLEGAGRTNKSLMTAWQSQFSGFTFVFYRDLVSEPLHFGGINRLFEDHLDSGSLAKDLLMPEFAPGAAQLLLSVLCRKGFFGEGNKSLEEYFLHYLKGNNLEKAKQSLLISSLFTSSTTMLRYLLEVGFSSNAFNPDTGLHALHYTEESEREEHRKLLLEYGADVSIEPERPYFS